MEHMQEVLVGSASVVGTHQREFKGPSTRQGLRETGGSVQTGASVGRAWGCVSTPPLTTTSRTQDRAESVGYFITLIVL